MNLHFKNFRIYNQSKLITYLLASSFIIGGIATSCSTKKNTTVSRTFHNLTSYYNYYFNAYESYKSGIKHAEKNYAYNYTLQLPVLLLGEQSVNQSVSSDMERTIAKCTALLSKHSITVKPKRKQGKPNTQQSAFYNQNEFIRWARESWLLVGKANTWKGDYDKATMAFEYVIRQFPKTPLWFEAQVWLARVSVIKGESVEALDRLNALEKNSKKPRTREFRHLLATTWAFYYQKQQSNEIIPSLKKSLQFANSRSEKQRYNYILAQLLQKQGKNAESAEFYKTVLKLNPPYEMAFSVKINLLALENIKGAGLKKELLKLANDIKNRDFLDQLYYTLGKIEQQEGNTDKAIEYFKQSASASTNNSNQKGMSYLELAQYYFSKADYAPSQAYYDSAYNSLDASYPGFKELEGKTIYLNSLIENINTIKTQDSLLRVASMPEKDRDQLINAIIAQVQADEEKALEEKREDQERSLMYQQTQSYRSQAEPSGGKWYFYNSASLSYGQSEFQMKWGKRKLEDNWRRKNKVVNPDQALQIGSANETQATPQKQLSNKTPEYYLANLPLTDSLKQIATDKVKSAMFKVAEIYQNDLNDLNEATKAYLAIPEKYPSDPDAATSYYRLYRIALDANNSTDANRYKSFILSRYPKSTYAILLSNPEYIKELTEKENAGEKIYEQAFALYKQKKYAETSNELKKGMAKVKETKLEPKYLLLDAYCIGQLSDISTFKKALANITDNFKNTDQAKQADNTLKILQQKELQLIAGTTETLPEQTEKKDSVVSSIYNAPEGEHMFVVLVPKKSNINQLRFNIISFNVDNFIDNNLTVNNQPLTDFIELFSVTGFKDVNEATKYYNQIKSMDNVFTTVDPKELQYFIISIDNFAKLLSTKTIQEYITFFKANYKGIN